ncbi:efflux RND transporter permease subunit [bacterium]|nr:efflux RND transporter permease subunit [bacterium]
MSLPEFSVKRPVTVIMLIGIIVVLGGFSLYNMGLELLPDINFPTISVITRWEGAAPEDVEQMITDPLEQIMGTIRNVKSVKSISREGYSIIMVEFEWGTNLDFAAQDMRDQISLYKQYLPSDAKDPLVFKFDVSMIPAAAFVLTGTGEPERLRKIAEDVVKQRLQRLEGVAGVSILGGKEKEVKIILDKAKITALGINPQQVIMAVAFNNMNLPAGYLVKQNKEYLLRTYGEYTSLDQIKNVVVGISKNYKPIRLCDVAKIEIDYKSERVENKVNDKDAIWIMITKESGANTVKMMDRVNREIKNLKNILPEDVDIAMMFDMSRVIKRVTSRTTSNAIVGGILAIILIFIFLRSWRPTLAISLAIPISILATFIALYFSGYTLNLMTLGGLALGVGMLVDNAVVVIENIYRLIEEGKGRFKAASQGATQVSMAITASTLTTIAVFFPVLFIRSIVGKLAKGLAVTIIFSLLASLFVALTLVPVIAAQIFKRERRDIMAAGKWMTKVRDRYRKWVSWTVKHKWATFLGTLAIFVLSLSLIPFIGGEFVPKFSGEFGQAQFYMPPGTPLEETKNIAEQILEPVKTDPDVLLYGYLVGSASAGSDISAIGEEMGPNAGRLYLRFKRLKQRQKDPEVIMDKIRKSFPVLKGARFVESEMSAQALGGQLGDIEVKIHGPDMDKLLELADKVASEMKKIDGITDVDISIKKGRPEYRIVVDREKAAHYGFTVSDVANAVKIYTVGSLAGRFNYKGDLIDITVSLDSTQRVDLGGILTLPVMNRQGVIVPLSQVAHIEETVGPTKIEREERQRKVSVSASVRGVDLNTATSRVEKLMRQLKKSAIWPSEYSYSIGGAADQMRKMFKDIGIALIVALLLVYMVMASQFESFLHPFVIMFTQPMAFIGVLWAFFITGQKFSMPSLLGIMILVGIVVNNGIVLVDFINQLRRKGMDMYSAIIEAGTLRLRPILITALTTIFGMLPMALMRTEGHEMRAPMAIATIGGLITATALTLLVLPATYAIFERVSVKARAGMKKMLGVEDEEE